MYNVFISKPNALNSQQLAFWSELQNLLAERQLRVRTLGETDFPNVTPLKAVREVMAECHGILILGFRQIEIRDGLSKGGTNKEEQIMNLFLPTAWNQIEAAVGFMYDIPMLIIREEGVSGGVFDVGNTDRFIHQAQLFSNWLHSDMFMQPFSRWQGEIIRNAGEKLRTI